MNHHAHHDDWINGSGCGQQGRGDGDRHGGCYDRHPFREPFGRGRGWRRAEWRALRDHLHGHVGDRMRHHWHEHARDFGPFARTLDERLLLALVLDNLAAEAGSGYEVVNSLERRLEGQYEVGPSAVYPVLRLAEDAGFVRAEVQGGRTAYALTDTGLGFVGERREQIDSFWDGLTKSRERSSLFDAIRSLRGMAREIKDDFRTGELDDAKMTRIKAAIEAARKAFNGD